MRIFTFSRHLEINLNLSIIKLIIYEKIFYCFSIIGPFLLGISNPIKADDWTYWGLKNPMGGKPYEIYNRS